MDRGRIGDAGAWFGQQRGYTNYCPKAGGACQQDQPPVYDAGGGVSLFREEVRGEGHASRSLSQLARSP